MKPMSEQIREGPPPVAPVWGSDRPPAITWPELSTEDDLSPVLRGPSNAEAAVPAAPSPAGTALQHVLSVEVVESPVKQQDRTYSLVSVSFTRDPADTLFAGVKIWFTGYKGNVNPVLVTDGRDSPVSFLAESTNETVVVRVQAFAPDGTPAPFDDSPSAVVKLDGVISAPPAPTISQSLVALPLGLQFAFNQLTGLATDIVDGYNIYRNTTNDPATASKVDYVKHNPLNIGAVVWQDLSGAGVTYYYWVSAVNTQGLESSKTAAQSSAVPSGAANLDSDVVDGAAYVRAPQQSGGAVVIENANFEASANLPPPGWSISGLVASYETATPQSGSQSLKMVGSGQGAGAFSIRKFKVEPGEIYKLRGYLKTDGVAQAGIQLKAYNASGSFISNFIMLGWASPTAWTLYSGQGTVPVGAVYMVVSCERIDVGGSSQSIWFDNILPTRVLNLDDEIDDGATYARTTPNQRDGGGRGYNALTASYNLASGRKLGGDSGLLSERVPEVLQDVSGVGMIKPGKFVDANMGMKTVAQDLAVGSYSGVVAGWRIVATAAISVPVGTASVTLEMVLPTFSGSGTLTLDAVSNLGFSITSGAGPASPQVARNGSGSLTQNSPVTGVGLTLSLYLKVDTSGASLSINNGKIRQDLITPLAIGTVT